MRRRIAACLRAMKQMQGRLPRDGSHGEAPKSKAAKNRPPCLAAEPAVQCRMNLAVLREALAHEEGQAIIHSPYFIITSGP